jgi:hypothetical protein
MRFLAGTARIDVAEVARIRRQIGASGEVATYGNSANGIEGPSKINILNLNVFSTVSATKVNEFHVTYPSDFRNTGFTAFADMPVWPNLLAPSAVPAGTFPLFTGIHVFDRDYQNPRIYSFNVGFEHELAPDWAAYADFTYAKGVNLTRFLNYNVHGTAAAATQPATRDTTTYVGANPFEPQLGDVFVTNSRGRSSYRGATIGVRKRLSNRYQLEMNYVLSKDEDDDSNERDPFTDRSFKFYDLGLDYGPSDRDIRHTFNFFTSAELPGRLSANVRAQARSAQPITTSPRVLNNVDRGRNWDRKAKRDVSLDTNQRPGSRRRQCLGPRPRRRCRTQ